MAGVLNRMGLLKGLEMVLTPYKKALKECKKVGTSHASGNALRAMYAALVPFHTCLREETAPRFFEHLLGFDTDMAITKEARRILGDPLSVWDII